MVNGKNVNKFIQEDLGSIHALIEDTLKSNKNTHIKAINNLMKEQLENLLSQLNVNKGSPVHKPHKCEYKSWTKTRIEQIQVLKFKASNVLTFKTLIVSNAKDHAKLNPHTVIKGAIGHTINVKN